MQRTNPDSTLYERLEHARGMLELGEEASVDEIKKAFHEKIRRWHPDKAQDAESEHDEKSRMIVDAYKTLMDYCSHYRISFSRETVERYRSEEEIWWQQFGNDPLWGGG